MWYKLKQDAGHSKAGAHIEVVDSKQLDYLVENGVVEPEGLELNPEIKTVSDLIEAVNNDDTKVLSGEPTDTKKTAKKAETTTTATVIV